MLTETHVNEWVKESNHDQQHFVCDFFVVGGVVRFAKKLLGQRQSRLVVSVDTNTVDPTKVSILTVVLGWCMCCLLIPVFLPPFIRPLSLFPKVSDLLTSDLTRLTLLYFTLLYAMLCSTTLNRYTQQTTTNNNNNTHLTIECLNKVSEILVEGWYVSLLRR